ncbi:MAG: UDP-N-acetylmuramate dehydrogenase [Deltaproteobacteria bacterium]
MFSELAAIVRPEAIKYDQLMSEYTTFKIGGPIDVLVEPVDTEQLRQVLLWCRSKDVPFLVFGAASNLLVRDKGIRGVGIRIADRFSKYMIEGNVIFAQAGILLANLARIAADHELTGIEFAEGIPGTLGGAVVMNAGAYDHEMREILLEADAVSSDGEIISFKPEDMDMGYRHSIFQKNGMTVVSARLSLNRSKNELIRARMQELADSRASKQPLDKPSAGSVFRRPEGYYVGPMVEKLGLKGYRIGGAKVSKKHAGFIVNTGKATAADVIALIEEIQRRAREEYGVELQTEIRIVGEE